MPTKPRSAGHQAEAHQAEERWPKTAPKTWCATLQLFSDEGPPIFGTVNSAGSEQEHTAGEGTDGAQKEGTGEKEAFVIPIIVSDLSSTVKYPAPLSPCTTVLAPLKPVACCCYLPYDE